MIDNEIEVYNQVVTAVRENFPNLYCAGDYETAPPSFPAMSVVMMDNPVDMRARTFSDTEVAVRPMYEVSTFSNKVSGKKAEAKAIMDAASDALISMGFTRTMCQPIPNLANASIHRRVARFTRLES